MPGSRGVCNVNIILVPLLITFSASSSLFGAYDLSGWTIFNSTQFCQTIISVYQFQLVTTDKLLISSFNAATAVDYISGFIPNEVYSFKTQTINLV